MKTKVNMHNQSIAIMLLIALLFATVAGTGLLSAFQLSGKAASIKSADVTVKQASDGNWYTFTKNGNKRVNYTGVAQNGLGWWRTENGKVNFKATGVYQNEYGWWRVENGKVNFKAKGVFQNSYGWWYCKDGKVQFGYTGIQNNKNGWWRIANGKVDFDADGVFQNELGWWYCRNGKVDFSYTGLAKNQHGTWSIKSGKVDFDDTKKLGYNQQFSYAVKEIETTFVETYQRQYSYDFGKRMLSITDQLINDGGDWGDGGPCYFVTNCLDGLLTKEMLKQYPEIAVLVSEGLYTEEMMLAYNPVIRDGRITTIDINGVGKLDVEDNIYHEIIKLTARNGLLYRADWTRTDDYGVKQNGSYSYNYDSAGLLSSISIKHNNDDYEHIAIRRDATGFPINIKYIWFGLDYEFEQYSLNYNSSKQLVEVEGYSTTSKPKTYYYEEELLSTVTIADYEDYSLFFDYNQDGLLTELYRYDFDEYLSSSTSLSWQTI